ncbi:hypothetical protein AVEN_221853-1 [Araneus ventricosus]|uniref:Transmembrane protein n=1 Tax=Araneus ventricosus TaxID=182803 RepID=A0A4Y2FY67_ARAVE|nr:hypothetical protein AVEN_221853-1 [Araneus ventricosus]
MPQCWFLNRQTGLYKLSHPFFIWNSGLKRRQSGTLNQTKGLFLCPIKILIIILHDPSMRPYHLTEGKSSRNLLTFGSRHARLCHFLTRAPKRKYVLVVLPTIVFALSCVDLVAAELHKDVRGRLPDEFPRPLPAIRKS